MTAGGDASPQLTFTNHLGPDDVALALRADVASGLAAEPKRIPPKWFYDETGSELFDKITRLDEYYPTEAERSALQANADEIVALSGADTVLELGSGSSDKTRTLLDSFAKAGRLRGYVPFDVSGSALRAAAVELVRRYPSMRLDAVVGDFDRHLHLLPTTGRRLLAFLGGTIGNYEHGARSRLLRSIADTLRSGETFLLGTDLVKDADRLVSAYDDSAGVTAAFNKNVLAVVNRELRADFDLDSFDHVARWNADEEWIEMWLRSTAQQVVTVADLDLAVRFAEGEEMLTEISAKFRREGVESELAAVGLELIGWWTDPDGDYAISLSRKP
ncbi:MAG: L-histidine N(alpha)-methyltransferase [Microthrixaceae bacterium]|nr:L-histidine N(alpha)-methyltransferase [Microthrixaceae bacterium]